MARHRAPDGHRPQSAEGGTTTRTLPAHHAHRAHHAAGPAAPVLPSDPSRRGRHAGRQAEPPASPVRLRPPLVFEPPPVELTPIASAEPSAIALDLADVPDPGPAAEPGTARERLPRDLLETLAWVGFAAPVAAVVIAAGDTSMERAALWAAGLSGIVVAAIALLALTGTRLDDLARCRSEVGERD